MDGERVFDTCETSWRDLINDKLKSGHMILAVISAKPLDDGIVVEVHAPDSNNEDQNKFFLGLARVTREYIVRLTVAFLDRERGNRVKNESTAIQ